MNRPSLDDVRVKAKESAKRSYETNVKQNAYWVRRLESAHLLGEDPRDIVSRPDRINMLTPAMLKETFNKYFPLNRYTVVTLVPEGRQ